MTITQARILQFISPRALQVLKHLKQAGFAAYLVGGGVRDPLLGVTPKDFDIVTDATPQQVRELFRNCYLIGRRFRLAHIRFGREIIEVATFRGTTQLQDANGRILRDNIYGTLEEDAWRRDFTINALYYDIDNSEIIDHTGGMIDLRHKIIRVIGTPEPRYREDPVRMLRALRLAAKLNCTLESKTAAAISQLAHLLQEISPARLFDETLKWFFSGSSLKTFKLLQQYGLFAILFPQTATIITISEALALPGFTNTDQRIASNKTLNPAFLFAVLLWQPLQQQIKHQRQNGSKLLPALQLAMTDVLRQQSKSIAIPRRLVATIKEIWVLQYRLEQHNRRRTHRTYYHPRFRAAYDFLLLRAEAGEAVQSLANWWTKYQDEKLKKI